MSEPEGQEGPIQASEEPATDESPQETSGTKTAAPAPSAQPDARAGEGGGAGGESLGELLGERPADKWDAFLKALSIMPNVRAACVVAAVPRRDAYRKKEAEPEFARAWEEALEEAVDRAEQEAWRRAIEGTDRPVFGRGPGKEAGTIQIGTVKEYSDRMLELTLKRWRPDEWRERVDLDIRKRPPKSVEEMIEDQVAELESRAQKALPPALPPGHPERVEDAALEEQPAEEEPTE